MRGARTFEKLLGIKSPWRVREVVLRMDEPCPGYDSRHRRWRHLDTMQHQTRVHVEIPRVRCSERGMRWSRFLGQFQGRAKVYSIG